MRLRKTKYTEKDFKALSDRYFTKRPQTASEELQIISDFFDEFDYMVGDRPNGSVQYGLRALASELGANDV